MFKSVNIKLSGIKQVQRKVKIKSTLKELEKKEEEKNKTKI